LEPCSEIDDQGFDSLCVHLEQLYFENGFIIVLEDCFYNDLYFINYLYFIR